MSGPFQRSAAGSAALILAAAALIGAGPQEADDPEIRLLNFHGGAYAAGSRHYVFWDAPGDPLKRRPVSLEILRRGATGWEMIAEGLPNTGRYLWSLPAEEGDAYRLRVAVLKQGGKRVASVSAGTFSIDRAAPDLVPYCKKPGEKECALAEAEAHIRFRLPDDPGPAPVVSLEVWASVDGGISWKKAAEGRPADLSIPIEVAPGETGIILVVRDAAGNRDDVPLAGSEPELRLLFKMDEAPPPPPLAGIQSGKEYAGGELIALRWNPPADFDGARARIEIRLQGKDWALLQGNLKPRGTTKVPLPRGNSASTQIRVVVEAREEGAVPWEHSVGPFRIVSPPPEAEIKKVEEDEKSEDGDRSEGDEPPP